MLMTKVSIALKRQIILTSHEPGIGPQSIRKQTDPPRSFSVGAVSREFNNPLGLADGQQFDPIAFFLRSADGQRLPRNGDMRIMGTSLPNKDTTFRKPDH